MSGEGRSLTRELSDWAATVALEDVPERVVELTKSQILSQLAAVRAGLQHPHGSRLVEAFGPPLQPSPRRSAYTLAALGAWLHFDDTAYAGHVSHSTVNVPAAYAHAGSLDGRSLILAVIAATECAARITASATLGQFRGQMAAFTHLAGSVAGRLRSEGAPPDRWVDAFGIAFAMPPWTLLRGFLGSDAKLLSAAVPVGIGLDACDAAHAGLHGAADILEHERGFLAQFAAVPLPETITSGLGRRWHTETLSFKVHPGGPGLDAALDCALELRRELGELRADDVEEVVVRGSMYTTGVDAEAGAYLDGHRSPVSALVFSVPYAMATALLTGQCTGADFAEPRVADPERWALAAKVRTEHDWEMTRRLALSTAPVGEALRQAGDRGTAWLEAIAGPEGAVQLRDGLGAPSADFETADKVTPAQVVVKLADGRTAERARDIPVGAAGPDTRVRHAELTRTKFLSTGGSTAVADGFGDLEGASGERVRELLEEALHV
jgi:2-methylcitrate dehydratase PrpD